MVTSIENIYISPLEICNLNCKYCYTKKIESILTNEQIFGFIKKYNNYLNSLDKSLKSITFCGGEVFIIPNLKANL
jgi:sulfatase maturation enzyme AslB (radical SAM superfamily)